MTLQLRLLLRPITPFTPPPSSLIQRNHAFLQVCHCLKRRILWNRKLNLYLSFFKTLTNQTVTIELKNDIRIRGILKSVDQYLNIKLDDIEVLDLVKYPHLSSVKNMFIRGSVVRYVMLPRSEVDVGLLEDATRRGKLRILPSHLKSCPGRSYSRLGIVWALRDRTLDLHANAFLIQRPPTRLAKPGKRPRSRFYDIPRIALFNTAVFTG